MSQTTSNTDKDERLSLESGIGALDSSSEFRGPVDPLHGHSCNDHCALIYEDRTEQLEVIVPFLRHGLEQGERCIYVLDELTEEDLVSSLREADIDVNAAIESGQLSFHTVEETYLRNGTFEPDEMIEFYGDTVERATDEYEALRIVAETAWLTEEATTVERFLEYEAKINDLFDEEDCLGLCLYDRSAFSPEIVREIIRTHPHLISDGTVCHNHYYTPPEAYLGHDVSSEVDQMLDSLERGTEAKVALRERRQYRRELYDITSNPDLTFEEKLQALFEVGCELFDLDFGAMARVEPGDDRFEVEHVSDEDAPFAPGLELPLTETYCTAAMEIKDAASVVDPEEAGYDDIVVYQKFGLRTYLGTYVEVENGPDRTFFFVSSDPRDEPFSEDDYTVQEWMGQWIQQELDRQHREHELERHKEYTNEILDAIDDVFYVLGEEGNIQQWNETAKDVLRCSEADFEASHVLDFFEGDDVDVVADGIQDGIETGTTRFEAEFVPAEGEPIPYEFAAAAVENPEGEPVLAGIGRDISDRVERERELELFRNLIDHSNDSVLVIDPETGAFLDANETACQRRGYSREELLDLTVPEIQTEFANREEWQAYVEELQSEGQLTFEGYHERADGSVYPVEINDSYVELDREYVLAVSRDITDRKERERELELFRNLLDESNDAVLVIDPDTGKYLDVNETACRRLGYPEDQLLDLTVPDVETELPDQDAWQSFIEELKATGAMNFDGYHRRKDGSTFPVEVNATYIELDQEYVLAIARDVTDRKESERALKERERQLSALIDNVPGMVYRCKNERGWPMEFVSDACRELTGYEPEAIERGTVRWEDDVIVEADQEEVWEKIQAEVTDREPFSLEYRIETADGERRWVRDYGRGIFDEDGEFVEIEGIISDVTERKRLETELQEVLGRVTDAFYALDDQWRFTHVNDRARELIDIHDEGLVGETIWETFEWAADSKLREEYERAMETQEPTSFELHYPDPLDAWYEFNAYPSETGLSVYFQDITERKEREQQLELFRNLIDESNDGVFIIDPDTGEFLDVNDTACERLGYDREELLGLSVPDIGTRFPDGADWQARIDELRTAGRTTFETRHERKNGSAYAVEVNTALVELDREYLIGIARDVTDRKRRERFLQELYQTTASPDLTFEEKIEQMLELGQEWFDLDIGYFASVDDEADRFEVVQAVGSHDQIQPGVSGSLSGTYCDEVIDADQVLSVADAVAEGWEGDPAYDTYGLEAYLGTALAVDGELYGTLSLGSKTARDEPFTETDCTFLELMSRWVSYELERNEREAELRQTKERFQTVFENSNDAIFINDPYEDEIIDANPRGLEMLGYERDELLEKGPSDCHPDEMEKFQAFVDGVFEDGHGWTDELTCQPKDGEPIPAEISASAIELDERNLMLAVVRDITERKKHERFQRELYEITADSDLSFDEKIERLLDLGCERFGLDQGYLTRYRRHDDNFEITQAVGPAEQTLSAGVPAAQPESNQFCRRVIERDDPLGVTDVCARGWGDDPMHEENGVSSYFGVRVTSGDVLYGSLWFGDTSAREGAYTDAEDTFLELMGQLVGHELEQRRRETQLATLNQMSRELMNAETASEIADVTVERATGALQLPLSAVLTYDKETGQLRPAAQTPRAEDVLPTATLCDGPDGPVWEAFVENETKVVDFTADDTSAPGSDLSQFVAIPLVQQAVFVTATTTPSGFTASHQEFIETIAATVEAALARADREQLLQERETALEDQNETLERINRINTTIREIDQVLIQASTRGEIEEAVCDKLADIGPYELAWIGTHDSVTDEIIPREWAGTEKGYFDAITITADDDPTGQGPAGRTIKTRNPQVVDDILDDPSFEPWRQPALNRGYHSVISLPLEYKDTLYGVLVVYAGQPGVFDELERAVLEEMAGTIAHAINATESKKALVSDELTELKFTVENMEKGITEFVRTTECEFSLETLVPQAEGGIRGFFSTRGVPAEKVLELTPKLSVTDLTVVSEGVEGDEQVCVFAADLTDDSLAQTVIDHGGKLSQFDVTTEGATVTVHHAADADVREFVEMFQRRYPDAELTAQRTHQQVHQTTHQFKSAVLKELTPRQREVLQTAYFNGYFDDPRAQTASEIAETLDITQPTFSSHIRASQRKLLRQVFQGEAL